MADQRHISRTGYGLPGLLAYIPSDDLENAPGTLETYRFSSEFPHFQVIGPLKTLYQPSLSLPPKSSSSSSSSSRPWWQRTQQTRWLFKHRPDAFIGNALCRDVYRDDARSSQISYHTMINDRPLLAIGQARIFGTKSGEGEALQQIMAVPAGESGQLLRLVRVDDSQWQWGSAKDAFVNISSVNLARKEFEATWEDDGLPIFQIKFAADRLNAGIEESRWLLVQKETSTSILRPKYSEDAVSPGRSDILSIDSQPSFINPNPVLTIRHNQTGNRAHADVVIIPQALSRSPQLAMIDECGYWIVWDLVQSDEEEHQSNVSLSLDFRSCGHIEEGLLDRMPLTTSHPSRRHGLLLVGPVGGGDVSDQKSDDSAKNRPCLVIWSEDDVVILDTLTNVLLPKLGCFHEEDWKEDPVLDIQRDPVHQNHIVMLTRRRILWVDLSASRGEPTTEESPSEPAILLQCPHLGTLLDDSRLFVCRASDEDENTTLVFVYYPKRRQLCTFWLRYSPSASIPQWNRDTISLPGDDESYSVCSIRNIRVDQAQLAISVKPNASSPGIDYDRKGVVFYQLTILWDDLRLQHCMCAISMEPTLRIDAPETRVDWLDSEELQPHHQPKSGRKSKIFVLPDEVDDGSSLELVVARTGRKNSHTPDPVLMKFHRICEALQECFQLTAAKGHFGLSHALFRFLRDELNEEHGYGSLPLLTWREIAEQLPGSGDSDSADIDTEDAVQQLFDQNGEQKVVTQLKPAKPNEALSPIDLPTLRYQFSQLWLTPVAGRLPEQMQRLRKTLVSEIARDEFLSSYGVMIQDTPLLGAPNAESFEDSQMSLPTFPLSSQPRRSSFSSPGGIMSSSPAPAPAPGPGPGPPATAPTEDGAVRRLSMLCSGLDASKLDMSKQSKIISYWPTERGVDPAEYISSIVKASEELLRGAKERLRKMEARRKARADKYKRPAFMRQGLPDLGPGRSQDRSVVEQSPIRPSPVKALSSQRMPESSQSGPSFAMSQPVAGAFGDRKRGRKAKRKSGFR